jgi:hypothetical protein
MISPEGLSVPALLDAAALDSREQGRFRFHSRLSDVAAPDGHYGEVAAAFVELRPGASLTESEFTGHCLSRPAAQAESA